MKLIIFLFLIIPAQVYCQEDEADFKGHVVYGEILGAGMGATVNYERTFSRLNRWFATWRLGTGYYLYDGGRAHYFALPVGVNLFSHTGHSHKEVGLNLTYAEGITQHSRPGNTINIGRTMFFIPSAGYRFQKPGGGLFLRVNYTPYIRLKEFNDVVEKHSTRLKTLHIFGLSAGYYFRKNSS